MGISIRIFFVNDYDSLKRIPLARYERLLKGDPEVRFEEYANKRVRYALIILEIVNRKPVDIIQTQYSILSFDSNGRIDAGEFEKEIHLGLQMLPPAKADLSFLNVVDARDRFAKKSFHDKLIWTPTKEIETRIMKAIFGKRKS